MLIHQAPPMTPTTTKSDNMPAPARSAVVIGLVMVSDVVVVGEVLPALGLPAEVPPVLFVNGIMASVSRLVPRMLRAAIWGRTVSAVGSAMDAEEHSPVVPHPRIHPTC